MKNLGVKLNKIKDFAKANKKVVSCVFVALLCFAFLFFGGMSGVKNAFVGLQKFFAGNEEIAGKDYTDNENGTYTLELSVTGAADTNVSKVDNVNVVIVYDRSNSMTRSVETGSSRTRAQEAEAIVTDFIQKLFTYQDSQHPENIQVSLITFAQCATQVSIGGNTWSSNETQITNAIDAITYNNRALGTNWYDALKMAETLVNDPTKTDSDPTFVIFVTDGAPTANSDNCAQGISPEGQPYTRFVPYYNPARQYARDIQTREDTTLFGIYAFGTDEDLLDELMYYSVVGEDRPADAFDGESVKDEYNKDVYFNAGNKTELQKAIDLIFEKVVQALGITEVTITDGTTNQVQTSTEVVSLLTIRQNSFKYWLTVPTDSDGNFQRVNLLSGDTITYHVEDNGNGNLTVSWTEGTQSKSVQLKGTIEAPGFKYQWTGANDLYNVDPPAADIDEGKVIWNLDKEHVGTLLNGVKYTVTFDVYPSQYTYDKVAELQNAADPAASEEERLAAIEAAYNAEEQAIKDYLVYNGDGTFSLRTNTEAFLDYTDTRTGETYHGKYKNPEPVTTDSNTLSVEKVWLNEVDKIYAPKNTPINLTLVKDGVELPDTIIEVKNANDWQNSMVISTGLLITTKDENNNITGIEVLTTGHDFSLKEPTDLSNSAEFKAYQWEFIMETVRPMVVDGVEKTLVLLKDEEVPTDTSNGLYQFVHDTDATYYNDGSNTFYKLEDTNGVAHVYYEKTANSKLNAYNTRKSNFNFTKEIDGDAPEGKKFKFFFTVNNSYPEEDIWYSVCDVTIDPECKAEGSIIADVETNGTPEVLNDEPTGYFSVPSGTETYVVIQENWNVRVTNVGTGTTYTIIEDEETLPNSFSLKSIVGDAVVDSPELPLAATQIDENHWEFNGITYEKVTKTENNEEKIYYEYIYQPEVTPEENKIEGEVVAPNTVFKTVFTNAYPKTHVTVNKEWDQAEQDSVDVVLYANGIATDKTATITKNEEGNYTHTFEDLDISDNNGVIDYSVIENDISGYKAIYDGITNVYVSASDITSADGTATVVVKDGDTVLQTVTLTEEDGFESIINGISFLNEDGTLKDISVTSEDSTLFYEFRDREVTIVNKEVVSSTVVKEWHDKDDQDGVRPTSLTVTLVINGTPSNTTRELNADNNWTATVSDLDRLDSDGQPITYTWSEPETIEGYDPEDPTVSGTTYQLNNKHETETTSTTVVKRWDDNANQDGVRPTSLTVTLVINGTPSNTTRVLNADNNWTATIDGLDKNAGGQPISYTWSEPEVIEGYDPQDPVVTGTRYTLVNYHETETTSTTVVKEWHDKDDQDGVRPTSLTVTLVKNGTPTDTTRELNADNNWTATIDGLDMNEAGQPISYTWSEPEVIDGYDPEDPTVSGTTYQLNNKHETETTSTTVVKEWHDKDNQDGVRPTSLTVTLVINGTPSDTIRELNADNNWTATIDGLDKNAGGQPISYTWSEPEVIEGYDPEDPTVNGTTYQLNNKHETETTSTTVVKEWHDKDNQDGVRPTSLTVTLVINGTPTDTTRELNADNNWTATINGLDMNAGGQPISYTWSEPEVIEGYNPEDPTVNGTTYQLNNKHETETTSTTVVKEWHDKDNQDGVRPTSLTVTLVKNGTPTDTTRELNADNNWTATIDGLDKNEAGQPISYTWSEPEVIEGYDPEDPTVSGTTYQLNNKHETETTSTTVVKEWHDKDNQDGVRPTSLTVTLVINGTPTDTTRELNADNNWTATIDGLDKNAGGQPISYTWSEPEVIEGYDQEDPTVSGTTYQLNNKHETETTSTTVVKEWHDTDNNDGKRPVSLTVTLVKNGVETDTTRVLNADNNWTATIDGLDKNAGGQPINYTWSEPATISYYDQEDPTIDGTTYQLNNKHDPILIYLQAVKSWNDDNNHDGKRPTSIVIHLIANDVEVDSYTLTSENADKNDSSKWSYTFVNKPKYLQGEEIVYTLVETDENGEEIANYTLGDNPAVVETEEGNTITLINTHENERTAICVTKEWRDSNDQDGYRPESIIIKLLGKTDNSDEQEYGSHPLDEENDGWSYTFENLYVYDAGLPITYRVVEEGVDTNIYTPEVNPTEDGFEIINTHETDKTAVSVTKDWQDQDNQDGIRADVVVTLFADGKATEQTVTLTEDNGYAATFDKLEKFRDHGTPIKYTVDELEDDVPAGYTKVNVTGDMEQGFVIHNKHDVDTVSVNGEKIWNMEANVYEFALPESITVILKADGEKVDSQEVFPDEQGNWSYSFPDLDKNKAGKPITYTVDEEAIVDYDTTVDNKKYIIENTYNPETTEVVVKKTWDDGEDQDGVRPEVITVDLVATVEGEEVYRTTEEISGDNTTDVWEAKFEGLPVYATGKKIEWSVEEQTVEGYDKSEVVLEIVNTHTPEVVNYIVSKTWDDEDDHDGKRPESITIRLYNDLDEEVATLELTAENDWQGEFTNLPKFRDHGTPIVYSIKEDAVEDYEEPEIEQIDDYTAEITNKHEREKVSIYITKTWEDNDDEHKLRPESILVDIYANGELIQTTPISADDNWEITITGLDKYSDDGEEITYIVKERPVEKYIPTYGNGNYSIINTLDNSEIEILPPDTGIYTGEANTGMIYILSAILGILSLGFKKIHE